MWRSIALAVCVVCVIASATCVSAQTADELREKIARQNSELKQIESEIAKYETELKTIGKNKSSLQSTLKDLEVNRKRVSAQIGATQNQIQTTELEISGLKSSIQSRESSIGVSRKGISEIVRRISEVDDFSSLELFLRTGEDLKIEDVLDTVAEQEQLQGAILSRVDTLVVQKQQLSVDKEQTERKFANLVSLQGQLSSQKVTLEITKESTSDLLKKTKNKESDYQKLLKNKKESREVMEKDINSLESKLKYTLDQSSLPAAGKGLMSWPVSNVRITQYFGNTPFAKSGAYSGKTHNGLDFGVPTGSSVFATLSGTVQATGNTDEITGCYSYGKWILIKHTNGISSLYAHLSRVSVSEGQSVSSKEIIGYSGNTGYSTGPHLHFTVYASAPVQIVRLGDVKSSTNCAGARIPIAPLQAYLNPMDYLQ
jgi:murein DD-endopeptidase MepM/ murein hydrolase activator NlpD